MHLNKGPYEPTLLNRDFLNYYQGLANQLKEINKLVTDLFHSVLLGDGDFKDHDLQPGEIVYWERHQLKTLSYLIGRDLTKYY